MTTLPQGDLPRDRGIVRAFAQHNDAQAGVDAGILAGAMARRRDVITVACGKACSGGLPTAVGDHLF